MLNIVSSFGIIDYFKTSKFFRKNLGLIGTVEKNGSRAFNERDKFAFFYNSQYRTVIYAQGNIGDIRFYTDHHIRDNKIAVYYNDNFEEFLYDFDIDITKEKGIDFYLGNILKRTEEGYEERLKENEIRKLDEKPKGDPNKIITNPGAVTYEDVKEYLKMKQAERFKI